VSFGIDVTGTPGESGSAGQRVAAQPQSGLCLDDPRGNDVAGDDTKLQIYTCNGAAAQQFALS
jgi:hypothetical protein